MSRIDFDSASHTYRVDGQPVPSVTQIIKEVVPIPFERAAWYGYKVARQGKKLDETRNIAAARGTALHLALADWSMGIPPDSFDYPDCDGFLNAIEKFIDANDPEWHDSECRTASQKHGYAGTLDAFVTFRRGKHKGTDVRFDLKSGRYYPDSHGPQIVGYEIAEVEQGKCPSDKRMVLKIRPTGTYTLVEVHDEPEDFLVLKAHWDSIQRRKQRKKK